MSKGKTKLEKMQELTALVAAGSSVVDAARVVGVSSAAAYTYRSKLKHGKKVGVRTYKQRAAKPQPYETITLDTPTRPTKGMDFVFVVPTSSIKSFMESMR